MESLDEIHARHRRELRELQGRITNKKKNATKKTRRGINDECAALEAALRARHEDELRGAAESGEAAEAGDDNEDEDENKNEDANGDGATDVDGVSAQLAGATLVDASVVAAAARLEHAPSSTPVPPSPAQPKKRNRQKERLARRAAEQAADVARAADEAGRMVDHAAVERAALAPLIAAAGRVEHVVRADGHCLFAAVADQLAQVGRGVVADQDATENDNDNDNDADLPPFRTVRHVAARYMAAHPDDFAPFLLAESPNVDLATHIAQIRDTAEWGGQLELAALASAYGVDIQVLHDGRRELIEPAAAGSASASTAGRPTLWLIYYRHGFGLGEHYNSLRAKPTAAAVAA